MYARTASAVNVPVVQAKQPRLRSFSSAGVPVCSRNHLLAWPFALLTAAATDSAGNKLAKTLTSVPLAEASRM